MSPRFQPFADLWEGVFAVDFTLDQVRRRCYALARTLSERSWTCLVAYDTRFMSNLFAQDVVATLGAQGISIRIAAAAAPLPAIQFALDHNVANCALVVSARNRPFSYNGLVLLLPGGASLLNGDQPSPELPAPFPPVADISTALPTEQILDLRTPYFDALRDEVDIDLIRRVAMTMFVDPMNGTTAGAFPMLIVENGQTRAIEINRDTDPLFGRVTPLPAGSGLTRLRKLVRESDSHLGLAFSADGTALGVVDKNGEQLELAEVALLLSSYFGRQYRQRGIVVAPPPTANSPLAPIIARSAAWEEATGLKLELLPDPAPRIAELLSQEKNNLVLGCTTAGEIVLGRYTLYPDAMLAGLFMAEMVARNGGNLRMLIDQLREQVQKA
jgi:phosphomannomutase